MIKCLIVYYDKMCFGPSCRRPFSSFQAPVQPPERAQPGPIMNIEVFSERRFVFVFVFALVFVFVFVFVFSLLFFVLVFICVLYALLSP